MSTSDAHASAPGRYLSPTPDRLSGDQAEVYDAIANGPRASQKSLVPVVDDDGRLLGPFGLMAIAPRLGAAVQEVGAAIRFHGTFAAIDRELAILVVATHHRCDFEWFAHVEAARAAGLTDPQLAAVLAGTPPNGLTPTGSAVWHAAHTLMTAGALDDDAYRAATAALGEAGLAELVWLCGYYGMLALALAAFDPELPPAARGAFARAADELGG
ncbi:carboxymuconolactone decarboxylase family protein [Microbacterium sp.]|uniref:carboxymuconolactone decarboxylase family protein n=1 Tax=Microbacterium sp. TaxID=51671 RepID=UPI003A844077